MVDGKFEAYCNSTPNIVADYRLGFKFVKDAFHVLLRVSDAVAETRIGGAQREGEKIDTASIRERNQAMRQRFLDKYAVDFTDAQNYHLVIDTDTLTPEAVAELIIRDFRNAQNISG